MSKVNPEAFALAEYHGPTSGIIALSADPSRGKTWFTIAWPFTPTLVIDTEFSAEAYAQHPHALTNGYGTRWSREPIMRYAPVKDATGRPTGGWETLLANIPPGRYRTISVDTVDTLWDWATLLAKLKVAGADGKVPDYKTGQMWGEAKRFLRAWLLELRSRCDWLFLLSHQKIIWPPPPPPAKPPKMSRAGEVIRDLASLMLTLDRNVQTFDPPAAMIAADGKTRWPAIPPRIPVFTPTTLLYYLQADQDAVDLHDPNLLPPPAEDNMAALERQIQLAERLAALASKNEEFSDENTGLSEE